MNTTIREHNETDELYRISPQKGSEEHFKATTSKLIGLFSSTNKEKKGKELMVRLEVVATDFKGIARAGQVQHHGRP